jgi:hypothetical protein
MNGALVVAKRTSMSIRNVDCLAGIPDGVEDRRAWAVEQGRRRRLRGPHRLRERHRSGTCKRGVLDVACDPNPMHVESALPIGSQALVDRPTRTPRTRRRRGGCHRSGQPPAPPVHSEKPLPTRSTRPNTAPQPTTWRRSAPTSFLRLTPGIRRARPSLTDVTGQSIVDDGRNWRGVYRPRRRIDRGAYSAANLNC